MSSKILDSIKQMEESYSDEKYKKKNRIMTIVTFIMKIIGIIYCGFVIMMGYNWVIPEITNLPNITLAQAIMLDMLVSFMVKLKLTDEDLEDRSIFYSFIRTIMLYVYTTFTLLFMFIVSLFI